ncbi:MAG: glycyl-radical enzyme activating protein [Bulleidia sp.]
MKTTGTIFNIQKFSVNDGPGIRTTVFLKGCPLHCRWCANPESQMVRSQLFHDEKKCVHCMHCIETCPVHAVSLQDGRVQISHLMCDACGKCIPECPGSALKKEGYETDVEHIMKEVMKDIDFYEESGGGMTISGGELFLQWEFAQALLKAAKDQGLHTCIETTGYTTQEILDQVVPYVDLVYFDVKHYDCGEHLKGTGVENTRILGNLKHLIETGKQVLPRIPVIPGFNAETADARGFADVLKQVGAARVQLLPFHQFGENKYDLLGKDYSYRDIPALHREDLQEYLEIMRNEGIDAFF